MASTLTPNMNLILPTVGSELGPAWAEDINASLSLLDQHNHASGNGVPITPTGLNINSDLSFISNNATLLRSVRFDPQSSLLSDPNDLGCLYESGVDLYYNDGNGIQIQITNAGGIAGTPGSIANLVPPASVTYVSATPAFVFQSNALTSADLDAGSLVIRENVSGANGITLSSPTALASNYTITLPGTLPSAQSFVTLDNAGNITAPIAFANGITGSNLASNLALSGNVTIGPSGSLVVTTGSATISLIGAGITINSGSGNSSIVSNGTDLISVGSLQFGGGQAEFRGGGAGAISIFKPGGTSHPIVVSQNPSTNGLIIVRGIVSGAGSIASGEGFSVSRTSAGSYTITFNDAFLDAPSSVATVQNGTPNIPTNVTAVTINTSTVSFQTYSGYGFVPGDQAFSFICIGQRSI